MKNLHNWALISEDAALLGAAKNDELPNVIHRLRKYREEGETIEACLPVFAAIIALSAAFPEILKVSFKSQAMKSEWALFCKTRGWSDLSGRIRKALTVVSMETGALHEVTRDSRMDPPARQTWLPWVGRADDVLQALMQAYAKTPRETAKELGEQLHEQWANGVSSEIKTHKEQTMNLTQKASAFFGNLKSVGLDLLRVQRGRATLHSAKRVIFAALPIKWASSPASPARPKRWKTTR